ncbi:MAG: T9SS type A sorting domain-containing protein [Bacteroidota bacterium]
MNKLYFFISLFIFISTLSAQVMDGTWSCAYATVDDQSNGTGYNTISVAVIGNNNFAALVRRGSNETNFLVGYKDADSINGRLGSYGYGSGDLGGLQQIWLNGFDQVYMREALDLASWNNLIFVPNNDFDHNILVFELKEDSIYTHPMRMQTGTEDSLWAIDIDSEGHVFVTTQGNSDNPSKVLVYDSPDNESAWSSGYSATPLQTLTLPDNGSARGITVNSDGSVFYVSNYDNGKIYAYVGNPTDGYTISTTFEFERIDLYTGQSLGTDTLTGSPWGLQFLNNNNILFAAMDVDFWTGTGYEYGRVLAINPNTGDVINELDVAEWNYLTCDSSYYRPSTTSPGNASGYTSTYNIDFDNEGNMYSQSYYGWTVEKWLYSGTLPTIELTITSVKKLDPKIPTSFNVSQNYPNPFNPSTTIEFSIKERVEIVLSIYNINGELVTHLINGVEFESGTYSITFNASNLSSGTYIYNISNGLNNISKKMTLIK